MTCYVSIISNSTNFFDITYRVDNQKSEKTHRNINGLCAVLRKVDDVMFETPRIKLHVDSYREFQDEKAELWKKPFSRRTKEIETRRLQQKYLEKVVKGEEQLRKRRQEL